MNWKKLLLLGASALSLVSVPASAQGINAVQIANGFTSPLYLCSPPGDTNRLFVVEQNSGQIKIIKNGVVLGTPFIDLGAIASSGGERGLLGLAFHPDYSVASATGEGKFYVNYTNNSGNTVVRQYSVTANPDIADAGTFANIFQVSQPFSNHNGGCIQFGADGMLYVGTGDGGSANDPGNRAQNTTNNLGKMLRFDVDLPAPYIPASNPFVGVAGTNDEIWAIGMRNPWRFSFDRLTGDMWIGDVGQGSREEVDFEAANSGGGLNYGWRCMEGTVCTGLSGCTCGSGTTDPVEEYSHGLGCSITGGYRYRGTDMPNYFGKYFFADYCSDRVWTIDFDGTTASNRIEHEADLAIPGDVSITSFGEDANGEIYIVDAAGGQIYRIEEDCAGVATNYCSVSPNSAGSGATIVFGGTNSITANDMVMTVSNCPNNVPGIFFYGPGAVDLPLGDGRLCVGSPIYRQQPPVFTDSMFGFATKAVDFTNGPEGSGPSQILPGSTWFFQFWFRDVAAGGAGSNTSDALDVTFCP
ncbi:MAG: glucose/arabinose dehydrogenase [Candidatus Paceibacteria bacterium]|jgi:glucose/arabinose dehydrogenase